MKIELKINGNSVYTSDTLTDEQWKWQDRYIQTRVYLERLARTEAIPDPYRVHIVEWVKALEAGTLPPLFPSV